MNFSNLNNNLNNNNGGNPGVIGSNIGVITDLPAGTTVPTQTTPPAPAKDNTMVWAIVIIIFLVLLIVGVIWWVISKK